MARFFIYSTHGGFNVKYQIHLAEDNSACAEFCFSRVIQQCTEITIQIQIVLSRT